MLRHKVRRCEIRKVLNVEPHIQKISRQRYFGYVTKMSYPANIGASYSADSTHGNADQWSTKDQMELLHFRPGLVPPGCGPCKTIRACWKTCGMKNTHKRVVELAEKRVVVFRGHLRLLPHDHLHRKRGCGRREYCQI